MTLSRRAFVASSATAIATSTMTVPTASLVQHPDTPINATPSSNGIDLNTALTATMEALGIPGALVLIDSPETGLWTTALGVADLDVGTPMSTDMHMRIGSITKTFTATMVLQLVDDGVLGLDDTLAALNPELADLPNANAITLRHLLSMQSGLAELTTTEPAMEVMLNPDPDRVYTPDELIEFIADEPAVFTPGDQFMYSNTNYLVLGMITEHLTGSTYDELIQTKILDQVGLSHTIVPTTPALPEPFAHGYAFAPQDIAPATSMATPTDTTSDAGTPEPPSAPMDVTLISPSLSNASGSMVSTLDDLHSWVTVLREGTLLSPELHEAQLDMSNSPDVGGLRYGFGIGEIGGGIGHVGGIEGFQSMMLYFPERDMTAVVMVNILPTRDGSDAAGALMQNVLER